MRTKSAQQLLDGVSKLGPVGGPSSLLAFWPVVDGKTAFADLWDRQAKGQFIKRPMLVGNNDHEGNLVVGGMQVGLEWASKQTGKIADYAKQGQGLFNYLRDSTDANADRIRTMLKYIEDCKSSNPARPRLHLRCL